MSLRTTSFLPLALALFTAACDGNETTGSAGTAGAAGTAGTAGTGGSGATAGTAGSDTGGTATGGTAGTGGTGGTGGTASGGTGGTGGTAGTAGTAGSQPFVEPAPFAVPLSPKGPDQLQSVTAAADDKFLAAGFAATAVGGQRFVTVVKFTTMGPDAAFGMMGVATTDLVFVGGSDEIDIATQSDGKILVSATVANMANANDRDVAVIRLLPTGMIDGGFGTGGVVTLNLNDGHDNGMMLVGLDSSRSITVDASDNIFIHAASRGLGMASGGGPRVDTDFTVVKLSKNGTVDMAFGNEGQFRLDIAEVNATPRGIKALPDGSLLVSGYANTPDVGDTTQAVLYKLTKEGDLDMGFATAGLFHEPVLTMQTEVYNFALHGANFVTAGYGRDVGTTNDYVSLRFDVATGTRDTTWGGAPKGAVVIDPSGMMLGSNARSAIALPGGETIMIGSTGPSNMPGQDAVFVVLDENGKLDSKYGDGIHVFKLGSDGNDQFWGGAVSGDHVALVGYKGGGMMQTEMMNDDSFGVVFKIQ